MATVMAHHSGSMVLVHQSHDGPKRVASSAEPAGDTLAESQQEQENSMLEMDCTWALNLNLGNSFLITNVRTVKKQRPGYYMLIVGPKLS